MVLEEGEGGDDAGGRDVDGQLILPDGESWVWSDGVYSEVSTDILLNVFGQT